MQILQNDFPVCSKNHYFHFLALKTLPPFYLLRNALKRSVWLLGKCRKFVEIQVPCFNNNHWFIDNFYSMLTKDIWFAKDSFVMFKCKIDKFKSQERLITRWVAFYGYIAYILPKSYQRYVHRSFFFFNFVTIIRNKTFFSLLKP